MGAACEVSAPGASVTNLQYCADITLQATIRYGSVWLPLDALIMHVLIYAVSEIETSNFQAGPTSGWRDVATRGHCENHAYCCWRQCAICTENFLIQLDHNGPGS